MQSRPLASWKQADLELAGLRVATGVLHGALAVLLVVDPLAGVRFAIGIGVGALAVAHVDLILAGVCAAIGGRHDALAVELAVLPLASVRFTRKSKGASNLGFEPTKTTKSASSKRAIVVLNK